MKGVLQKNDHGFCRKNCRPYSIRRFFLLNIGLVAALFSAIFLSISVYFSSTIQNQSYIRMKEAMKMYNGQASRDFKNVSICLMDFCSENADVSGLGEMDKDAPGLYTSIIRIKKQFAASIASFSYVDGFYIYAPKNDSFVTQLNSYVYETESNFACSKAISNFFRTMEKGEEKKLDMSRWFLLQVGDESFLFRAMKIHGVYTGAWANIERVNSSFQYFNELEASVLYVDEKGRPIGNEEFSGETLHSADAVEEPFVQRISDGTSYLTVSNKLDYCDYYIVALIPTGSIDALVSPLYSALLIAVLIFAGSIFAVFIVVSRLINEQEEALWVLIASMRKGHFDARIENRSRFVEVENIVEVFNSAIDEIRNLRIDIYKQKLMKKEIEIQYLKGQIAPHFLINCLNTIFTLSSDTKNRKILHETIRTLSEHLRYTLSSQTTVSLEEEIRYVKNYLTLTALRFPECVSYRIETGEETRDATVFPLLVLMLTENSIKNNVTMGEEFSVEIHSYSYEEAGRRKIHITHVDSGKGFSEEALTLYNHMELHENLRKDGCGIGIYNIVMRLRLIWGEEASIRFSNEPGSGARIDIDFPYIPYQEGEEI